MKNLEKGKRYYSCKLYKNNGEEIEEYEYIGKDNFFYLFKYLKDNSILEFNNININDLRETREEAQQEYNNFHNKIREMINNKDGIIDYMIDKINQLIENDEYGYCWFTPDELKIFKTALKEKYNREFNYD